MAKLVRRQSALHECAYALQYVPCRTPPCGGAAIDVRAVVCHVRGDLCLIYVRRCLMVAAVYRGSEDIRYSQSSSYYFEHHDAHI